MLRNSTSLHSVKQLPTLAFLTLLWLDVICSSCSFFCLKISTFFAEIMFSFRKAGSLHTKREVSKFSE